MAGITTVKANPTPFKDMLFIQRTLAVLAVVLCVAVDHIMLYPHAQAVTAPCSVSLTCCDECGCWTESCSGIYICYAVVGDQILVCDGVEYTCHDHVCV